MNEVPNEPVSQPSQNEVVKVIEILNRLTLLAADLDLDPLLLNSQVKLIKEHWTE